MDQRLVGVDHLLQVDGLVTVVGEGGGGIEVLIGFDDVSGWCLCADDRGAEDATCKVATIRDEVDVGVQIALHLPQALANLGQVLMGEGLVDAQVAHAPGEVGGGGRLLPRTGGAGDGVHGHGLLQQVQVGGGQQGQLYGSGEAARVGHMLGLANSLAVDLG